MIDRRSESVPGERHILETILSHPKMQPILGWLGQPTSNGMSRFERVMLSFQNPEAPLGDRVCYYPIHTMLEHVLMRRKVNMEMVRFKLFHHRPTLRALVNAIRSVRHFGLGRPQPFIMPLMVVWNFTQACNLSCSHCYQNASHHQEPDEMSLEEKLRLVDEMADNYVPFLALAGGEPLMGKHFWEVLKRCQERHIHVTIASNGTMLTPVVAQRLADHGVKYVEISLDSTKPQAHDEFRGIPGAWQRTIDGIRTVASTPGMRAGMAACISQMNVNEVDAMIRLAIDLECATFVHFNYIPVGRGQGSDIHDLSPDERESVLQTLVRWMNSRQIGVMSTAPQLGRACLMYAETEARMAIGHAGSSPGGKTRVLARYIGGCGSARCYCSVQPNGDVTPCVYIPHIKIGNLRKQSLKAIWQSNEYLPMLSDRNHLKNQCHTCDYRDTCGGCRARAEAYFGDILAGDPGCVRNTTLWENLNHVPAENHVTSASSS